MIWSQFWIRTFFVHPLIGWTHLQPPNQGTTFLFFPASYHKSCLPQFETNLLQPSWNSLIESMRLTSNLKAMTLGLPTWLEGDLPVVCWSLKVVHFVLLELWLSITSSEKGCHKYFCLLRTFARLILLLWGLDSPDRKMASKYHSYFQDECHPIVVFHAQSLKSVTLDLGEGNDLKSQIDLAMRGRMPSYVNCLLS